MVEKRFKKVIKKITSMIKIEPSKYTTTDVKVKRVSRYTTRCIQVVCVICILRLAFVMESVIDCNCERGTYKSK